MMSRSVARSSILALLIVCGALDLRAQQAAFQPNFSLTFGSPTTFATHAALASYGFAWGVSDGLFGAIPRGNGNYTFYGGAGCNSNCSGTAAGTAGVFSFTGTLDHVSGSNGCKRLFGPGSAAAGWTFDRDYAGGGKLVRFSSGSTSGWLMTFHAEYHWKNMANTPSYWCLVGNSTTSAVPCFYSSIGLAVSIDDGKTFQVAGQIIQPSQPLTVFEGGAGNMDVGYGSLMVADANGKHLDNPPPDPSKAYFYVLYSDFLPGLPGACGQYHCAALARAPYADTVAAALSGDPNRVAQLFHKYDGSSPNPWNQPATAWAQGSATPDLSGVAGKFAPLWTDDVVNEPDVLYDGVFDVYLTVYPFNGARLRASKDLIHWSPHFSASYSESGNTLAYLTLQGETGDPTIGGFMPRLYFSSFPTGVFPDYTKATFESVPVTLTNPPKRRSVRH
jgi:hypothetical protein